MRRRMSVPVLIAVVFAAAVLALLALRVFREGALGCARVFERASYYEPDEIDRLGIFEPAPTEHIFTDEAYDAVYPDLYEPMNGEN